MTYYLLGHRYGWDTVMVGTYACEQNGTTAVSQMQTWYNCTNLFNQIQLLVMKYDEFNIPL